ncbi:MAG: anthranilate synthase component I family protein, partial [Chitinophagaceae bacterium]
DWILAAGASHVAKFDHDHFSDLQAFHDLHKTHIFGFLGYDLKNELEVLESANPDKLGFPEAYFFIPTYLLASLNGELTVLKSPNGDEVLIQIREQEISFSASRAIDVTPRIPKEQYLEKVAMLKDHIKRGDIYEATFCQEFFADDAQLDPLETYLNLTADFPTPFASFFKLDDRFIISASPERFLSKRDNQIISQPIKGTSPRSDDPVKDRLNMDTLRNDPKEQAENVMIVDLVRHDLSRIAMKGTVKVSELFGIYSFPSVHQMISTVICTLAEGMTVTDAIRNCFPMGSMTGAPKIRAMQLIDQYEETKRGVYSGTIGWIGPSGDFGLNVVIRTLLYNSATKYLSFQVGGAITHGSDPQKEYEECLLKAQALLKALKK